MAKGRVHYCGNYVPTSSLGSRPLGAPCVVREAPLEKFAKVLVDKARGLGKDARAPYFPVGLGFAEGTTPPGFSEMFVTTSAGQAALVAWRLAQATHLPVAIEPSARRDANLASALADLAATEGPVKEGHGHRGGHGRDKR